ncbi:MAG: hypothetical protein L7F78_17260, partial [Syntrophales bacterium LBB04]|nr:hypothetical protein [Syntrophales bacterium LBB04]
LDDPTFTFWLPAFKVNASIFLMLAERASLAQAAINDAITETGGRLYPVTLPAGEAAKLLKVVVALLIDKRQMTNPIFAQMSAKPTGEPQLFFIPFSFSGYELIQEKMRVSVHPNALKYGKNL